MRRLHSFNNLGGCLDEVIAAFVERASATGLDTSCADRIPLPPFALPAPAPPVNPRPEEGRFAP